MIAAIVAGTVATARYLERAQRPPDHATNAEPLNSSDESTLVPDEACLSIADQPLFDRPHLNGVTAARAARGELLRVLNVAHGPTGPQTDSALEAWSPKRSPLWYQVRADDGRAGFLHSERCFLHARSRHAETKSMSTVTFVEVDGDGRPDTLWIGAAYNAPPEDARLTLVLTTAAGWSYVLDRPGIVNSWLDYNGSVLAEVVEVTGEAPSELVLGVPLPMEGGSISHDVVLALSGDQLVEIFEVATTSVSMYSGFEKCATPRYAAGEVEVRAMLIETLERGNIIEQGLSAELRVHRWDAERRRFVEDERRQLRGPLRGRIGPLGTALRTFPDAESPPGRRLPPGTAVEVDRYRTTSVLAPFTWDGREGDALRVVGAGDGAVGWVLSVDVLPDDPPTCPTLFAH